MFDLHIPGVPDVYWHAESLTEAEVREQARRTLMFNRPGTRCVVRRAGQPLFTVRKARGWTPDKQKLQYTLNYSYRGVCAYRLRP